MSTLKWFKSYYDPTATLYPFLMIQNGGHPEFFFLSFEL